MNVNVLLVTFSLRNPNKDYSQFLVTMRGNALQWLHFIEQTCILTTLHDVQHFADLLYPHIESTDSFIVVRIVPHEYQGFLPKEAWDWLNSVSANSVPLLLAPDIHPPKRLG